MFQKKDYVFGAILIYLFLIMMVFIIKEERMIHSPCAWQKPCVRFCCSDSNTCKEEYIREEFNETWMKNYKHDDDFQNDTEKYKILFGRPLCTLKTVNDSEGWKFDYDGEVRFDGLYYNVDKYCMKKSVNDEKISFNLQVCATSHFTQRKLHLVLMFVSVLFLAATVFVYAYVKDLRTDSGRIFLFFAISILIVFLAYPYIHFQTSFHRKFELIFGVIIFYGFLNSYLWMSVMSFDIWWTFRKFRETSDDSLKMKLYYAFVAGFCLLWLLMMIFQGLSFMRHVIHLLVVISFGIALFDIMFLIHTATMIFRMTSESDIMERSRFEEEKKRFFIYFQLYIIMIVTWPIEFIGLMYSSSNTLIVCDIIKCNSAVAIFCVFVMRKSVRSQLFQRYSTNRHSFGTNQLVPESP